jgi:pimeloyl-ACP methyl ester carboxylesterase
MNATANSRTAQTRYLELGRPDGSTGRIAYDDRGTGPLVLLAPGMGIMRTSFRFLAPLLLAAGYRVVTTDYRGMGESDTGWDEYSSAATGRDLIALLRRLDAGPALLYGDSYAAAAAVHVLADAPELLRGAVLAGPFVRDLPAPNAIAKLVSWLVTKPPLTRQMWMAWVPRMYPKPPADFAEFRASVAANFREPGRTAVFAKMCAGSHAPAEAKLPRAAASGVPVLVVMGTADADFPDPVAEAERIGAELGAPVEFVEGLGHHPHEEDAEQIAALVIGLDPQAPEAARSARAAK